MTNIREDNWLASTWTASCDWRVVHVSGLREKSQKAYSAASQLRRAWMNMEVSRHSLAKAAAQRACSKPVPEFLHGSVTAIEPYYILLCDNIIFVYHATLDHIIQCFVVLNYILSSISAVSVESQVLC